jgi:hypothetical protein
MRKFFAVALALTAIAGPAVAATEWEANSRRCAIDKWFSRDVDAYEFTAEGKVLVVIEPKDIPALEKAIALLKACSRFWSCVDERDAGAKKRCHIPR